MSIARKAPELAVLPGGGEPRSSLDASKYEALFDQASDAILVVNGDGSIEAMNQAAEELTGFVRTELVGAMVKQLSPDSQRQRIPARARALTDELFSAPGTYEDVAILRKDGYLRLVDASVRVLVSGGSTLAFALLRDLTEKKQMERELITKHAELKNAYYQLERKNVELESMQQMLVQAGKMAALGELAAGIAHELNQPLQGIRGYAQELRDLALPMVAGQASANEVGAGLREIISNVDKMAQIIDYLRAFTRKSTEKHELTDVHHAVEEALKMLDRQFKTRGIVVERNFGELPKIYANPLQIEQVFINLATNARDAIEATGRGSGKIRVTTRSVGDFVEVVFRDDGIGMSEMAKAKAFNPFFTTKEVGKGMGLGLSLSYGMISKLHGSIVVESELGKGAAFTVRLPRDFRELA